MKERRTNFGLKLFASLLWVAAWTVCLACGNQVSWLSANGGYQGSGNQVLEEREGVLARDRTTELADAFQQAKVEDRYIDLENCVNDRNFFFTIKTPEGETVAASQELGDYREKYSTSVEVQKRGPEKTIRKAYPSEEACLEAVNDLEETYQEIDYDITVGDDVARNQEETPVSATEATGEEDPLYYLEARVREKMDPETYIVTGFLRSALVPSGEIYAELGHLSAMYANQYVLLGGMVVSGLVGLVCLAYLLYAAGYRKGREGISLLWMDRHLGGDLQAVVGFCLVMSLLSVCGSGSMYALFPLRQTVVAVVCLALVLAIALSLVRQKRAGILREGLLYRRVLHPASRAGRRMKENCAALLRKLPLFWGVALGFLGLCFLEGLCIMAIAVLNFAGVILWFLLKAAEAALLIYVVLSLRQLQEGGCQLAAGNLDYKVPLEKLRWAFRAHGENLGNIRQGIQHAVEEQMKSERMKTELITNVSHDIKTPLTSIVNYVDLLKKEEMPNDRAKEYLEVLDRQSARLKKLTEDLVEASKASTGNVTVNFQRTDVNVLLTQSAGEYEERLSAKGMTLVLTPAKDTPAISADGRLLWRIFENLFSNIHKYAMPGTRVYLTCEAAENQVIITFRNISATPLNISSEELMERFVRGDTSRNTEGSGLGLSIARSLTQLQHGQFDLTIDGDLFKAALTFPRIP